jgi:PAS domain S-box-containing protein
MSKEKSKPDILVRENESLRLEVAGLQADSRRFSEHKLGDKDLGASEMRYRRLFESAQDGILILDADDGKIVDVNPFLVKLTGYSHEDFLGKHLWEIGSFKDIAASRASFAKLQAQAYVRYENLPLETRDGRKVDVEFVSNVYSVDDHNVIQCNIRDITARKFTEKRAEDELKFRNLILSTQLEVSIDGILVVDVNGKIVSSNRRFAELWDVPLEILESKSDERSLQWVMEKLEDPEEFMRKVKYTYANPNEKIRDEIVLKDSRTFDRYSAPMLDRDGKHFGRVWQFRDITERKRAEEERGKLEQQLRSSQKMEAIGSLAGGVAHDFNNLISVILNYTEFAMESAQLGDQLKDDLLEVKTAAERAAVLTRQLLAFSRKQVLQPVLLDLNKIAVGVEKMLRRILGEDIELVLVLAPDLGMTLADPGQIEQVFMNLVVNARDAMPRGGKIIIKTTNVEIDDEHVARGLALKLGHYVEVAVADTGCGIDEPTKARLYEPFFTTKEKGKGTGLGLSTVYGIVKQSAGNISVDSEPGLGTTFKIYLPRELVTTQAATISAPVVLRRSTGTETILMVEDEEALRKVAKRTLEAAGYTVLTAANGDEALLICAQHVGDIPLLVTDVVMPRMSGRQLAERLLEILPKIKVLYMSGYTDDAIVHHGVIDAGTHFLSKPFTAANLTQKVQETLDASC